MRLTIKDVFMTLCHSIWVVVLTSVICASAFFAGTYLFIDPEYTATAKMYVYIEKADNELYLNSSDLSVSKSLVDTYLIIVKSDPVLEKTANILSYKYPGITAKMIDDLVYGNSINETEAFYISATSTNRQLATDIINTIIEVAPSEIIRIVKAASVELIEPAQLPTENEYDWPIATYSLIGFLLGFALSATAILVSNAMDKTIYGRRELVNEFNLPILGTIPEYTGVPKINRKSLRNQEESIETSKKFIIDKKTSFPVSEAYRKARTSIFYLPFENNCKKIVITSAVTNEGKSTTATNLSIMLAQADKKVLLVDADMRRPKISKYLSLMQHDGLSEFLAGITSSLSIIKDEKTKVDIVSSGQSTSSAAELLASPRIDSFFAQIDALGYDFVIIDSPPVNVVTDATVLSDKVDGYIIVSRAGHSDINETKTALASLEQIGAKVLGIIINNVDLKVEQYGRYKRYGRYYDRYAKYYYKTGYNKYNKYSSYYETKEDFKGAETGE